MLVRRQEYVPALRYRWLDPLFDPGMRYFMREQIFKGQLVQQAALKDGEYALDVGCGTGTLAMLLKRDRPNALVVGIDMDSWVLEMARSKSKKVGVDVDLEIGTATKLPYRDESFDRGVSTLVLHHLTTQQKEEALKEILRVLKPGGQFGLADLGTPSNVAMRLVMFFTGLWEDLEDNLRGLLPQMMEKAGFVDVQKTGTHNTPLGTVALFRAWKRTIGDTP